MLSIKINRLANWTVLIKLTKFKQFVHCYKYNKFPAMNWTCFPQPIMNIIYPSMGYYPYQGYVYTSPLMMFGCPNTMNGQQLRYWQPQIKQEKVEQDFLSSYTNVFQNSENVESYNHQAQIISHKQNEQLLCKKQNQNGHQFSSTFRGFPFFQIPTQPAQQGYLLQNGDDYLCFRPGQRLKQPACYPSQKQLLSNINKKAKKLKEMQKEVEQLTYRQSQLVQELNFKQNRLKQLQEQFICPITQVLLQNPVVLSDCGHTFERASIQQWLSLGNFSCPLCKSTVRPHFVANYQLSQAIQAYKILMAQHQQDQQALMQTKFITISDDEVKEQYIETQY